MNYWFQPISYLVHKVTKMFGKHMSIRFKFDNRFKFIGCCWLICIYEHKYQNIYTFDKYFSLYFITAALGAPPRTGESPVTTPLTVPSSGSTTIRRTHSQADSQIGQSILHALKEFKKSDQQPPPPSEHDQRIRSYLDHSFYNVRDIPETYFKVYCIANDKLISEHSAGTEITTALSLGADTTDSAVSPFGTSNDNIVANYGQYMYQQQVDSQSQHSQGSQQLIPIPTHLSDAHHQQTQSGIAQLLQSHTGIPHNTVVYHIQETDSQSQVIQPSPVNDGQNLEGSETQLSDTQHSQVEFDSNNNSDSNQSESQSMLLEKIH